ncbi:MAG: hypothetical protein ACRKFN_08990 [Desulfitobacterium sp.]
MLISKAIAHPDVFEHINPDDHQVAYGSCQRWYPTTFQRLAGCGPCAATNIFYYLTYEQRSPADRLQSQKDWVALMKELWHYVTPSLRGVHKLSMFYKPMLAFAQTKGIELEYYLCEVPEAVYRRPSLAKMIDFLADALDNNAPIAFLNWHNGEVKNLSRWHWVTIIQLDYEEDKGKASVTILDEGILKKVDLALWIKTTTLGGGFVYFTKSNGD